MKTPEEMQAEWAKAISEAGAMTEKEMREAKVPTHDSIEEVAKYIQALVDRPHDYGTCCYAMSMAATAAFNYVAHKLGVTGFQASCADMDILRRTRGFKWGKLVNFDNLMYPQYCTDEHYPGWQILIQQNKKEFARQAKEKLAEDREVHPNVQKHWEWLASLA